MIHPARQSTKLPGDVASQDCSTMELRTMAPVPPPQRSARSAPRLERTWAQGFLSFPETNKSHLKIV